MVLMFSDDGIIPTYPLSSYKAILCNAVLQLEMAKGTIFVLHPKFVVNLS